MRGGECIYIRTHVTLLGFAVVLSEIVAQVSNNKIAVKF